MFRAGKRVFSHITQMQELHNGEIWMTTTGQGMFRLDERQTQAVSVDDLLNSRITISNLVFMKTPIIIFG